MSNSQDPELVLMIQLRWDSNERGFSVESSLQRISSNFLLWKRNDSSVVLYTWSWRGSARARLAESKRRALRNYFPERICYMFLQSKCRGDRDLWLCPTSVLSFRELQRNGKIRFFLRQNTFFPRILSLHCGSPNASTEVVHSPKSRSPLHFDIGNI